MRTLFFFLCIFTLAFAMLSCNNPSSARLSSKDSLAIYDSVRSRQIPTPEAFAMSRTFFSDFLPGGDTISFGNADTLVTQFNQAFPERTAPMRTKDSSNLRGFFINSKAFNRMFGGRESTKFGGFMIFFGKKDPSKNECTIVLMPTEIDPTTKWPTTLHPELSWEEVDPCPNRCGNELPRNGRSYSDQSPNFGDPKPR